MTDQYMEPADPRAKRLHLHAGNYRPDSPQPSPGDRGVFPTACGRKVRAVILSAGDEPALRLCASCRRRGNP